MQQKELTKTFTMISNWKKAFGFHGLYKNILALLGLIMIVTNDMITAASVTCINTFTHLHYLKVALLR